MDGGVVSAHKQTNGHAQHPQYLALYETELLISGLALLTRELKFS